jgi:hypothetical protein
MAPRTDVHSPVHLVTEDYDFVTVFDTHPPEPPWFGASAGAYEHYAKVVAWWRSEFDRLSALVATSEVHRGLSQCHHCGAHVRYCAVMHHRPTGQHIAVGEICLDNRFSMATAEFQKARKAAELDRQKQALLSAYKDFCDTLTGDAFMLLCPDPVFDGLAADFPQTHALLAEARADSFVADVRRRARQYGNASDKQVAAVVKVVERIATRKRQQAEREAEVTVPAELGRQVIDGEVVGRKYWESDFGGAYKVTVKVTTPQGVYRVWGSEPSKVPFHVGDKVRFVATVERSKKGDDSFGIFKRPGRAEVLS